MSNKDFRRDLNEAFDQVSGAPSPTLRDRVRSALAEAPPARGPYWIAAVAAFVIAALIVTVLWVNSPLRQSQSLAGPGGASPSPTVSPSTQLPPFSCGTEQDFIYKPASPPITPAPITFISALRTGTHGTYDRITIEFANGPPNNAQISAPAGTTFTGSPSGLAITVKGEHGIAVVIRNADLHSAYNGPLDIVTGYPTLAEVRRIEDFEGVVQLAIGFNGAGCSRAFFLANPDRLVIDIQSPSGG